MSWTVSAVLGVLLTTGLVTCLPSPHRRCLRACPMNFDPVCGSDGSTYPNTCSMVVSSCMRGSSVKIVSRGRCATNIISERQGLLTQCPVVCVQDYRPVCGSDGLTYPNTCALRAAGCRLGVAIKVRWSGPC